MTGIIKTKSGVFLFRGDVFADQKYWAWHLYDDPGRGDRVQVHKWNKLPKGELCLFDVDNPPETVPYIPMLD